MSLRTIAKELGVSHTLLVLWRQGKRTLSPELARRYEELVTSEKSGYTSGSAASDSVPAVAGVRGSRTHLPRFTRHNGFEVREGHPAPSTPERCALDLLQHRVQPLLEDRFRHRPHHLVHRLPPVKD